MSKDFRNTVLLKFSEDPADVWTVDDATKGTSIIGGTGSGKTSASGKTIAMKFLEQGWGGLVLCAKSDEAKLWEEYCEDANRGGDVIIFRKGAVHKQGPYIGEEMVFNPIDYELYRSGEGAGETQNITNIFMNIYRMGNRIAGEGDVKEERYWDSALKRCLNRIIELIKLSGENLTYRNMVQVVTTATNLNKDIYLDALIAADRGDDTNELNKRNNYCLKCLVRAGQSMKEGDSIDKEDAMHMVEDYFTYVFPNMDDRTRSIVTESFLGLAEPFLSGILNKHFAGETNIFPEWTFEQHKIIILDFPIKEFLDAGIVAECIFKLMFQQAVERRNITNFPTPVFLWGDEYQYFVNPYDQVFLTTARSSRTASVFLSQNISNYLAVMGSNESKARVDSLLGNLCTKIFHSNTDAETNEYASRLIGQDIGYLSNVSVQQAHLAVSYSETNAINSQYLPQIQPREFTTLKTGGEANDYKVNSIIIVSGKEWFSGKNYLPVTFTQSFKTT